MIYDAGLRLTSPETSTPSSLGLAFSDDGIHWTRYHGNPILTANDMPSGAEIMGFTVYYEDNTYFLFVSTRDDNGSYIWLIVFEGTISP